MRGTPDPHRSIGRVSQFVRTTCACALRAPGVSAGAETSRLRCLALGREFAHNLSWVVVGEQAGVDGMPQERVGGP